MLHLKDVVTHTYRLEEHFSFHHPGHLLFVTDPRLLFRNKDAHLV